MAMTATERQRKRRARLREERAAAWIDDHAPQWAPTLRAWASRGLRLPPSPAQLTLMAPYAELARGPGQLGAIIDRSARADYRRPRTTYGLVAAVLRAMEQLRQLANQAQDAFQRPLGLDDPHARRERGEDVEGAPPAAPRRPRGPDPGQVDSVHSLAELLRLHGTDPELVDRLERGKRGTR